MDIDTRTKILFLFAAVALIGIIYKKTAVHETDLPFGTTDLSSVEHRLERLPPEEARLVRAYVKRSNGDYLPGAFADPDSPFTAKTFGDAIELQRNWERKTAERKARIKAERDARLGPLLAIADVEVLSYERMSRKAYDEMRLGHPAPTNRLFGGDVVFTRVRLTNLGDDVIEEISGTVQARLDDNHLPLNLCYFKRNGSRVPGPGESMEFDCAVQYSGVGREVMEADEDKINIEWTPQFLRLANGRELSGMIR